MREQLTRARCYVPKTWHIIFNKGGRVLNLTSIVACFCSCFFFVLSFYLLLFGFPRVRLYVTSLALSPPQKPLSRKIGKREIERARVTMGRGKRGRKPTAFSLFSSSPARIPIFFILFFFNFCWNNSGSLCRGESLWLIKTQRNIPLIS